MFSYLTYILVDSEFSRVKNNSKSNVQLSDFYTARQRIFVSKIKAKKQISAK